jgi:hypothetical protein
MHVSRVESRRNPCWVLLDVVEPYRRGGGCLTSISTRTQVANRRDCQPEPGDGCDVLAGTLHVNRLWTVTFPVGPVSTYR